MSDDIHPPFSPKRQTPTSQAPVREPKEPQRKTIIIPIILFTIIHQAAIFVFIGREGFCISCSINCARGGTRTHTGETPN